MAIQHALYEPVIGIGVQTTHTTPLNVESKFDIGDFFTPNIKGKEVVAAWYEPIGNLEDFAKFDTIRVDAAQPTAKDVTLVIKGKAQAALLRIRVHALFE